jgi:hypothetical protein
LDDRDIWLTRRTQPYVVTIKPLIEHIHTIMNFSFTTNFTIDWMIDWLSFNVVFQLYLQTVNNVRKKDDTEVVQIAKI